MWYYTGKERPPFAIEPGPEQESVWDYPRPPAIEHVNKEVIVKDGNQLVATTNASVRILETAGAPTYYIPPADVGIETLLEITGSSFCEWKGSASYFALQSRPEQPIGWCYKSPTPEYAIIKNYISFYPGRIECYIEGERVQPQPGHFYGGWVTADIVGPIKGEPGSSHW